MKAVEALRKIVLAAALCVGAGAGHADVVLTQTALDGALAGDPLLATVANQTNPSVTFGGVSLTFGGFFVGQDFGGAGTECAALVGSQMPQSCVTGDPTGTLQLDTANSQAVSTTDSRLSSGTVVSGGAGDTLGPIALLFGTGVSQFTLDAGFFDATQNFRIRAYDSSGALLFTALNDVGGIVALNFSTTNGTLISGLLFDFIAPEPNNLTGFTIGGLTSISTVPTQPPQECLPPNTIVNGVCTPPDNNNGNGQVPEPTSLALVGLALVGLGFARRRMT